MSKKTTPAKKAAPSKSNGKTNGNGAHARSATNGGHIPTERYAKDPKSVVKRLVEKTDGLLTQAANAVVRAEKNGVTGAAVNKLQASMGHLEAAKKALA